MGDEELNNSTKEDHEESRGAVGGRDDKKKDKSIINQHNVNNICCFRATACDISNEFKMR